MKASDTLEAHRLSAYTTARAMGWFSIALGVAELVCARPMARAFHMRGRENLIRGYGLREIATGVGLLAAEDPKPWMWGRVAGDALDLATLATRVDRKLGADSPLALGLAAVAGATVVDVMTARALGEPHEEKQKAVREYRDYTHRSGYPQGVEAARGAARDAQIPQDMRTPPALRPWGLQ
jgi:hypothetical protein